MKKKWSEMKVEVLEEKQCDGYHTKTIRLPEDGTTVHMRIPDYSPEEEKIVAAKFTRALFEMAYPDEDWSKYKELRIIT